MESVKPRRKTRQSRKIKSKKQTNESSKSKLKQTTILQFLSGKSCIEMKHK